MKKILKNYGKNLHFIGINGSGMFPMAQIMHSHGFNVTGSDNCEYNDLKKFQDLRIKVFNSHTAENVKEADIVIFSAAIKETNPEIIAAKEKNLKLLTRSEMMGLITQSFQNSVSVAGTHGKTTTTAMITHILLDAKKDPTAIIGGRFSRLNGNCRVGASNLIISEACEYIDSFLSLHSEISVILNVDADHLDYFENLENVEKSFEKFALKTKKLLIVNGDDNSSVKAVKNCNIEKIFYGFSQKNDFCAKNIIMSKNQLATFEVFHGNVKVGEVTLGIPGNHNVYNALAAIVVCLRLGVDFNVIKQSIVNFHGVQRRFENLGNFGGITIIDDFAHHPAEIKTILEIVENMGFNTVWAIFQPHTYSRTFLFLKDFAEVMSLADKVVISEILPVRETNVYGVHAKDLVKLLKNAIYLQTFKEIAEFIVKNAKPNDLILTMGGGNIHKCAQKIVNIYKNKV